MSMLEDCKGIGMSQTSLAFALAASALLLSAGAEADAPVPGQVRFYGLWSSGAPCRWYNEFHWSYDRRTVSIPKAGSLTPDRACRILKVTGKRPTWVLSLSCTQLDQDGRRGGTHAIVQRISLIDGGWKLRVVTSPSDDANATIELNWCRSTTEPEPPLLCPGDKPGSVKPCEP